LAADRLGAGFVKALQTLRLALGGSKWVELSDFVVDPGAFVLTAKTTIDTAAYR
jgi:hypothetical protein